jgi:hypothetical protein
VPQPPLWREFCAPRILSLSAYPMLLPPLLLKNGAKLGYSLGQYARLQLPTMLPWAAAHFLATPRLPCFHLVQIGMFWTPPLSSKQSTLGCLRMPACIKHAHLAPSASQFDLSPCLLGWEVGTPHCRCTAVSPPPGDPAAAAIFAPHRYPSRRGKSSSCSSRQCLSVDAISSTAAAATTPYLVHRSTLCYLAVWHAGSRNSGRQ